MAEGGNDDSKTEQPTDKRIADALESGNIPVSREATLLAALVAALIVETLVLPGAAAELAATLAHFIDDPAGWRLDKDADALQLLQLVAIAAARFLLPSLLVILAFGVGSQVAQNAPRLVADRIQPDFSRLSIRAGLARLFGARGLTEFAKSLFKLAAVGIIASLVASGEQRSILSAMFAEPADLPQRLAALCVKITAAITLAMLALAGADVAWARIHWRRDLRMSRQDLKDEMRQAEGDRMIKARFRSLRLARARRRMLKAVPKATMVVVNPTHYAVAMRYVRGEGAAPTVLAKGVDLVALKIREIAQEHGVPVVEDRALARALHDSVQVDSVIPPEFYRAVAEIVHLINGKRSPSSSMRRRIH